MDAVCDMRRVHGKVSGEFRKVFQPFEWKGVEQRVGFVDEDNVLPFE